jgi:hypothetical protein
MKRHGYSTLVAIGLMMGCSSASEATRQSVNCNKSSVQRLVEDSPPANVLNLDTGIPVLKDPDDLSLGIAYLDFDSSNALGEKVSRRCTARFKGHPVKADSLLLFSATHCNFPPESVEFANAKTTLQIWGNSGYFSVPVTIEGQNQLGEFARTGAPYLEQYGGVKALSKWSRETSEGASLECQARTSENTSVMVSGQDRLACASESDFVILVAQYSPTEKYKVLFQQILESVEKRNSNLSVLTQRDRDLFAHSERSRTANENASRGLREMAYSMNINFCNLPEGSPLTLRKGSIPINTGQLCTAVKNPDLRKVLIAKLESTLKDLYTVHMKEIVEQGVNADTSAESQLFKWHKSIWGCNISSLDQIDVSSTSLLNECDLGRSGALLWRRWVVEHQARLAEFSPVDKARFGLNPETYFTLGVNSLPSQSSVDSDDVSKSIARIFNLAVDKRKFLFSPIGYHWSLFTFSPVAENMFLMKKDSGSIFSALGVVPMAALSTIDGEPTSGGASITPLPEVDGESSTVTSTGPNCSK